MSPAPVSSRSLVLLVLLSTTGLVGCGKVQARTPAVMAALDVPAPPARVTVPVVLPDPGEPEPPAPVPAAPAAPNRNRENGSAPPRTAASTPAAAPPAASSAPDLAAGPVLQTTPDVGPVAQQTLTFLTRAQRDLDSIQSRYKDLSPQAREQYDSARGFIRNARHALDIKNYAYAQQLATKAAAVASALVKG